MKKTTLLLSLCALLITSCQKDLSPVPPSEPIDSTPVSINMSFVDSVWYIHTVIGIGGKYQDTSAFMQQTGLTEFLGDSWYENMVWTGSWWTNNFANPLKCFNRGIGGQTHSSLKRFIDSSVRYLPRLVKFNTHAGINECLQFGTMTPEKEDTFLRSLETSTRDYYNHLVTKLPGLQYNIQQIEPSPKLYQMGYKNTLPKINQLYQRIADSLVRAGHKSMVIKTHDLLLTSWGTPDSAYFKNEGSRGMYHLNTLGYDRIKQVIKDAITGYSPSPLPAAEGPLPIPVEPSDTMVKFNFTSGYTTGCTYPRSWKYFPELNANATTAPTGQWIKSFEWKVYSSPVFMSLATPLTGKTKVINSLADGYYALGTYKFICTATTNTGAKYSNTLVITIN